MVRERQQLELWRSDLLAIVHAARESSEVAEARLARLEAIAALVMASRSGTDRGRVDPQRLDELAAALRELQASRG